MGELDKFKELPHINSLYEIVDDWGYAPNLYHFDGSWHVTWIHCEEGDGLDDFVGESPEEAINKAYEWYQNKFKIDKAKAYIKEYTRHCSNELVPSGYHEWVTPDNALRACEIAKHETLDKVCEYLYDKLYTRANGAEHYVASKEKITQTEFVDKLRDYIGLESKNKGNLTKPKFKIGDWIVNNEDKSIGQITEILYDKEDPNLYGYKHTNGYFANAFENDYHIWTIQDAKPGDVLMCESGWTCIFKDSDLFNEMFSSYCFMTECLDFMPLSSECHTLDSRVNGKLTPATEKQHKLFFKKMKEAGYGWNPDKKELYKRN